MPPEIAERPTLHYWLNVYWEAFWQLTTCRNALYMTEGQIPWSVVEEWGRNAGMTKEERGDLWLAIAAMDNVYLDHKSKQLEQNAKANIPAKVK